MFSHSFGIWDKDVISELLHSSKIDSSGKSRNVNRFDKYCPLGTPYTFQSPKCKIKVTKRNHENPINFSAREYSKSVYMTGANNALKKYYHDGRRYSELLEYPSRTLSLASANEFIKYIILLSEISVGLMPSPLFIFLLRRLRKFKTLRMDSVSCSSASNFATLSRRQT